MKKQELYPFLLLWILFFCLSAGLFAGRNLPERVPAVSAVSQAQPVHAYIDLNTADRDTLMTLPGIGQTLAGRILDYRSIHGSFASVQELVHIEGIGEARLEALLPYITAGG